MHFAKLCIIERKFCTVLQFSWGEGQEMKILLTNDDGFFSPGLQSLKRVFVDAGHDLWIVAPDSDRSGMSHYITVGDTIRVRLPQRGRARV